MRPGLVVPAGLLAVLALAGCAGQTSPPSSAEGTRTSSSSSDTSTATSPSTGATSTTSAPSTGASQRSASASLARTKGYATYEGCQGTCTGAVPAALRRPLQLPAQDAGPCPITVHVAGPVGPRQMSAGIGFHAVRGSSWLGAQVTWIAAGAYTGPVLIRGARLGGPALGFGTRSEPYDELQLLDSGRGAPRVAAHGRSWITYTRVPSTGCYAYQVDGRSFSEVVVFRAVG